MKLDSNCLRSRKTCIFMLLGWLLSLLVVAWGAAHLEKKHMMGLLDYGMKFTQADLAASHLERFGRINYLLGKGCIAAAKEQVAIDVTLEQKLLAQQYKEDKNLPVFRENKFDFLNDATIIKLQNGWAVPDCPK
jgi:hypothetical protein